MHSTPEELFASVRRRFGSQKCKEGSLRGMVSRPFATARAHQARAKCSLSAQALYFAWPEPARRITQHQKVTSIADESLGPPVTIVKWRKILEEESEKRIVLNVFEKRPH
jgi:hypothetical protein